MRFATIFVLTFAVTYAAEGQAPDNPPAGNADSGKKLYAQYGCYQCHGYAAQGGTGPRLAPRPLPYAAFSKYTRQPSGEMPPYTAKVVSDSQLADIHAFLRTVPQPPPVESISILNIAAAPAPAPQNRQQQAQQPPRPAPRWPDGRANLGTFPGEKGHWIRQGRAQLANNPDAVIAAGPGGLPTNLVLRDVPFQPWARALFEYRQDNFERDAPHARCKPSPGPRQVGTAYGFEIVDMPELKRTFIFDIGGPYSFRIIYMDGRPHPKNLEPTYTGHSIGRWEGDTLVVDTVGFNEGSWIEAEGLPHTDQLHLIERFTRTDFNTLKYEVTVDDPAAYSKPWNGGFLLRWNLGAELFEYVCQDNNKINETTAGADGAMGRTSMIVP